MVFESKGKVVQEKKTHAGQRDEVPTRTDEGDYQVKLRNLTVSK